MPTKPGNVKVDLFPNRALAKITMSAANTLTFEQLRFAVGVFQGVALVLHRVEFHPEPATVDELTAAADHLLVGLVTNDNLSYLTPDDQDVLVRMSLDCAGASVEPITIPLVADFSTMPGGGIIVPANPLYLAMNSAGFAAAGVMNVVIYYTFKSLSDKDYLELVQTMIPGNI